MADGAMDLFPYDIRPIQKRIIQSVGRALIDGDHVVIEAGTGSGKTVSALAPSLSFSYRHGKRVLYLTRTNSQQKQVVEEFRRIRESCSSRTIDVDSKKEENADLVDEVMEELNREMRGKVREEEELEDVGLWEGGPGKGICVAIQGRNNLCPLTDEEAEFITGTPEELSKMCSERKRNTTSKMMGKPTGGKECRFFSAYLLDDGMEARKWLGELCPTAEELYSECMRLGICPYEVTKAVLPQAVLVTAPYIYFLSPFIRRRLLEWMDCGIEDLIIVVDEAHNLAQFSRELSSISLSTNTLRLALAEVEAMGDHRIGKPFTIRNFLEMCLQALTDIAEEYLIDEDGLVPPSAFSEAMMMLFKTNSSRIDSMASEMLHHGQAIQDQKKAMGKLPRSYIHKVALFYKTWQELEFESFSPLINKSRRGDLSLEAHAMDASLITSKLLEAHGSIHLSGTLSPLNEYRDTIGLPEDTPMIKLPPPFPPNNRLILFDQDLTTNYEVLQNDPEIKLRFRERIEQLLSLTKGRNTAIFFPSFDLMGGVLGNQELEDGSTLPAYLDTGREFFIEKRGSSQGDVMDLASRFKESRGGVLVSVLGGRLSEGMDFPGKSLEAVLIVGIPYPKPNARQRALSAFYDIKFGKGWEYTVHAPAARRLMQAVGRMIRSENERGGGMILDKRAKHFSAEIPDMEAASEGLSELSGFFEGKLYLK
jgi:DNA excision repair protein ERCC-2